MKTVVRLYDSADFPLQAKEIHSFLEQEDVVRAERALRAAPASEIDPISRAILEARVLLLSRRFRALEHLADEIRSMGPSPSQEAALTLVEAYGLALAGKTRTAFKILKPLVRSTSAFEENRAEAVYLVGLCCMRRGHYKWAKAYMESAASFYRLSRNLPKLSNMLGNIALVEKNLGHTHVAVRYLEEAARIAPKDSWYKLHRRLLCNRGVCYMRLGRLREARSCFARAEKLSAEAPDRFMDVTVSNNLGLLASMFGEYEKARDYHRSALEIAREEGSSRQECLAYEFLGDLAIAMGQPREALSYLSRAYELAQSLSPQGDLMIEVLRRCGDAHALAGDKESARRDLSRAAVLARSRGDLREETLAKRSLLLLNGPDSQRLSELSTVLTELRSLGDQFEFMKTVYLVLASWNVDARTHVWLQDAVSTATHYLDNLGIEFWKKRFRDRVGHSREIVPVRKSRGHGPSFFLECRSPAFEACLEAATTAARSEHPVLLLGETGSGKEFVARLIHRQSSRCDKSLVAINCGGLPESLVDSELFGHARGTFTGAHEDKPGLFEVADGGTVFLDEVAELPLPAQVKLLRFLDSGEYRRVGETKYRRADVRVISATNRDLDKLLASGEFRTDLLYRLKVFQVEVPPLRDRTEDILPLAQFFLEEESLSEGKLHFAGEVENTLKSYAWPGNVRELRNVCRYLAARAWGRDEVVVNDLPDTLRHLADGKALSTFERQRLELEREQMIHALRRADGKIMHAAKLLGIGRNTFAQRMRALGIDKDAFRR